MKILVCVSNVPDTTSKINFTSDKKEFDKTGIQWIINPLDEVVLNKAIEIKQKQQDVEISVANVGASYTESVLRKALAIGADNAFRIDTEPKDSFSTAKEIANLVKNQGFDLVLCGAVSIDYYGNSVPAILAEILNFSFVNSCLNLQIEGKNIQASRDRNGNEEFITTSLPAVVAAKKGLVEDKNLIIPNMRSIMSARMKPLSVETPIHVDVFVENLEFESMPLRGEVKMFSEENLDELINILRQEVKVI